MNKTQFYTLGGALLASTALTGAASAGTIGKFNDTTSAFTTTPLSIANTIFSGTAATANAVVISSPQATHFGMRYSNTYQNSTRFSTEFTLTGARFVQSTEQLANVAFKFASQAAGTTGPADALATAADGNANFCVNTTALAELFVVNDCKVTAIGSFTTGITAIYFTGVNFNTASGLATVGSSVVMTGKVFNPDSTTQIYEAATSGTILTAAAPFVATAVTAGNNVIASATATPLAFSSLTAAQAQETGLLSVRLATVSISATGALLANLTTVANSSVAGTTTVTLSSSILSSSAVSAVTTYAGANTFGQTTLTNFSGGSVTFTLNNNDFVLADSFHVTVSFGGTNAIPAAAAGTVTATVAGGITTGSTSQVLTGATAAFSQGGFRAEVNTFNASTNGPFSSYLRIHNNGVIPGVVTITIRNDDHASGTMLGSSFTTAAILPNGTMQLSAAEMEGTTTSTKLPAGGANVPVESRVGSYTVSVTGPIIGYVQHILFDGNSVADLSGFRNRGQAADAP